MCGRYTLIADAELLGIEFELLDVTPFLSRRYNIAPTQNAIVVRNFEGRRRLATMRWSFVPAWTDEPKPGPPLINARSETVATSPAFRAAFRRRRCIVPCSGFYEWKSSHGPTPAGQPSISVAGADTTAQAASHPEPTTQVAGDSEPTTQVVGLSVRPDRRNPPAASDPAQNSPDPTLQPPSGKLVQGSLFDASANLQNPEPRSNRRREKSAPKKKSPAARKQPYLIRPRDGRLLALAGIWESWESRGGEIQDTFAILTTTPNRVMAGLHNRMPVILDRRDYDRWLDPALESPAAVADLLKACPDEKLELFAVSDRVNSVRFDDESCIAPWSGS